MTNDKDLQFAKAVAKDKGKWVALAPMSTTVPPRGMRECLIISVPGALKGT